MSEEKVQGKARFLTPRECSSAVRTVHLWYPIQSLASAGFQLRCQATRMLLASMKWAASHWKPDKGQQFIRHRPKSICKGTYVRVLLGP